MKVHPLLFPLFLLPLSLAACSQKQDVDTVKGETERLRAENAKLKAQLAKVSALPVSMSLRKAKMGPGYVAAFTSNPMSILVTVKSTALGTVKKFEVHQINPLVPMELSYSEGAVIEKGDTIILENKNYSSLTLTANPN